MGHASKGFLSYGRFMPSAIDCSRSGTQTFRMCTLGPSCFDEIRTRIYAERRILPVE